MVGSKGMRWLLLAVWFFMAGIEQGVHGIFVKFKPGESKCFIEMLRKDEVMMITYKSPDQTALPKNAPSQQNHESMMLKVTEQQGKQIFEGQTDVEGRFAFTALTDGSHNFCWSLYGQTVAGKEYRIHMDIKEGLPEEDHSSIAKQDHLSTMEAKVNKLKNDIKRVQKEQKYFRNREQRFKKTSDSTNFRTQWFSVIQILGMFLVTALHLSYLRYYFIKKKVV